MTQLISESMRKCIKAQIEEEGRCTFQFPWDGGKRYCHFLANPECGHYGERDDIDTIPARKEFYRCLL